MASSNSKTISLKFTGDISDLVAAVGGADAALTGLNKKAGDTSGYDTFTKKINEVSSNISLLPAAIATAAPLAGGALIAGVGAAFAGIAVLAQSNNDLVVSSFADLRTQAVNEIKGLTADAVPYITESIGSLQDELTKVQPQLSEVFQAANPGITTLTDGVDNLITNIMPGLVRSAQASNTVLGGVSVLLGDVGTAGDLALTGLSSGASQFAGLFGQTGSIVENVGSIVGRVLPAMSSGIGATLSVVNFLTQGLATISPVLGDIAGYVPLATVGFKGFALANTAVDGINTGLTNVSKGLLNVAANAEASAPNTSKLFTSLATGAENLSGPFGVAVVGGGLALLGLAAIMGKTTISSQDLTQAQENLTAAMVSSNGQITAASTGALIQSDAYKTLIPLAQQAGVSQTQLIQAITQGGSAYSDLQSKLQGVTDAGVQYNYNGRVATTTTSAGAEAAQGLSQGLSQLHDTYDAAATAADAAANANAAAAQSAPAAYLNFQALAANAKILADNTQSADSRLNAFTTDLTLLGEGGAEKANDAVSALYQGVNGLKDSLSGTSGALLDASGNLNLTTTRGEQARSTFEDMAAKLAAYNQALVSQGDTQDQANAATSQLADQLAGPLASALGLNVQKVKDLIAEYYQVPPNINTTVTANVQPAQADLNQFIAANTGRTILINTGVKGIAGASNTNLNLRATGGPVTAGRAYIVGDGLGPEVFVPNQSGTIKSANDTANMINGGSGGSGAAGPMIEIPIDLSDQIRIVVQAQLDANFRVISQKVKAGVR